MFYFVKFNNPENLPIQNFSNELKGPKYQDTTVWEEYLHIRKLTEISTKLTYENSKNISG